MSRLDWLVLSAVTGNRTNNKNQKKAKRLIGTINYNRALYESRVECSKVNLAIAINH